VIAAIAILAVITLVMLVFINRPFAPGAAAVDAGADGLEPTSMQTFTQGQAVSAVGTSIGQAIELSPDAPLARTAIAANDYYVEVRLSEISPDAIKTGVFEVQLLANGKAVASLFVKQANPAPRIEEARLQWSLGKSIDADKHWEVNVIAR
jgi:hypothetical protein